MRLAEAVVAILLLAAACGSLGGSFEVRLDRNGMPATATIVDETGLITAVSAGAEDLPDLRPNQPFVWNPNSDLTRVGVSWESATCSTHSILRLTGNALLLTIDEGEPVPDCGIPVVTNLITLRIDRVVDTASITVRLVPR